MKKLLLTSLLLVMAFVMVACDTSSSTVTISNVELSNNVLEADFKLNVTYETDAELYELITSAVNQTYDHYKTEIGTKLFTLYFSVYAKDSDTSMGVISYQVNSSKTSPGLTLIGDNFK